MHHLNHWKLQLTSTHYSAFKRGIFNEVILVVHVFGGCLVTKVFFSNVAFSREFRKISMMVPFQENNTNLSFSDCFFFFLILRHFLCILKVLVVPHPLHSSFCSELRFHSSVSREVCFACKTDRTIISHKGYPNSNLFSAVTFIVWFSTLERTYFRKHGFQLISY